MHLDNFNTFLVLRTVPNITYMGIFVNKKEGINPIHLCTIILHNSLENKFLVS